MLRLLFIFFGFFHVVHGVSEEDFYDEEDSPYSDYVGSNLISYGGITIECDAGCGDVEEDPTMQEISLILDKTIRSFSRGAFPVWIGSDLLVGFEAWEPVNECEYAAFDWPQTNGFLITDLPIKYYSATTHSDFLELVAALRRDVQFYFSDIPKLRLDLYRSTLSQLYAAKKQGIYGNVEFGEREELEFLDWGTSTNNSQSIQDAIGSLKYRIQSIQSADTQSFIKKEFQKKTKLIDRTFNKVDALYRDIFIWCLENHQPEGIAFRTAIEDLISGEFEDAMNNLHWLIEEAEKHNFGNELFSKLYLLKGQLEAEGCLYAEAVIDFTQSIQKDPSLKEAYFDRAAAYFELGQFDQAIEDFIRSGIRSTPWSHPTQWGVGIAAGMAEGSCETLVDFIPALFGTLKDVANGLWAFSNHPVQISQELVNGIQGCVEYLRSQSLQTTFQDMVPELKRLFQEDEKLTDFERGKLVGLVIGKYGTDIFFAKYATKAVKSYHDLKKANQLLTLEALASPQTTQEILAKATQRWALREEVRKNGNLKIHPGRQAKHIEGHPNYLDLCKESKPSIFTHTEPDRLIQMYAGTGRKFRGNLPGTPGYQEIVNFEEFIGYAVNKDTGVKTATTWGKIHYSQDGVHIVPYTPLIAGK